MFFRCYIYRVVAIDTAGRRNSLQGDIDDFPIHAIRAGILGFIHRSTLTLTEQSDASLRSYVHCLMAQIRMLGSLAAPA